MHPETAEHLACAALGVVVDHLLAGAAPAQQSAGAAVSSPAVGRTQPPVPRDGSAPPGPGRG
ncbi:hypothetical protein [Quadrisphaera sp. KR29]|uniref:hypothetical protein n=1 Tax=Quadrisphaera sp. KR29 TaxID=3461391 RepID=UPI004043D665